MYFDIVLQVPQKSERSPIFFYRSRRRRSARHFFGKRSASLAKDGALANFSASFFTGSREDGALANFSASFLQVPQRTERSPIFWQPLLQVPQRTERSLIFWQPFLQLPQRRSARQFSGMLGYRSRRGHSARIFFSEKKNMKKVNNTRHSASKEMMGTFGVNM